MIVNTVQLSGSLSATSPHHQAERERERERDRIKSGLALRFASQMGPLCSTETYQLKQKETPPHVH